MAAISNTFVSTSAKGNRESLSNVVTRITPEDTPIYSMIKKVDIKSTHPEWETDDLATPAENAKPEGDDYVFDVTAAATRLGNYTQIFSKSGIISGTQDAVDNAGRMEQIKEQKLKKSIELRKDVEFAIVSNTASVATGTRYMGGLPSWIATNVSRGSGGSNGGYSSGTGLTVAATDGTQRAFSKALLDTALQSAFNSGANVKFLSASPYVKSVFVTFMSDSNVASFRYAAGEGGRNTIVGNADVYESPYGKVTFVPNRVQAVSTSVARNVFLIDPEMVEFGWLRKIQQDKDVAKTGDAERFVIIGEGTLKVKSEKGLGVVADVYGMTSSS